jgi:hypothetical protein
MSVLSDIYIKTEVLETLLNTVKKKGEKGISITVSIQDEANQWGQNVSGYVSQTKEQREAKKDRFYVGNGKVFWTDGKVVKAEKKAEEVPAKPEYYNQIDANDDLPF